jgi:hypothetical protein
MIKASYLAMRDRYFPTKLKTVFVLESPPASGKYFYNEEGRVTEPLFSGIMRLLNFKPKDKRGEDMTTRRKNEGSRLQITDSEFGRRTP